MKKSDINKLAQFVKQVGKYKPADKLRQPSNPPPKKELERKWKYVKGAVK